MQQAAGYRAFIPAPLPPSKPPLAIDGELLRVLSRAEQCIGRLDGVTSILPDPDLFVSMYVRQEAVLSSQIEGTQSTLEDILQFEAGAGGENQLKDVAEVVNYVAAMNHGLARLNSLPLSGRLIREIHGKLLQDGRGAKLEPGQFRRSQNWIGPAGCTLSTATFVPPPVEEMKGAIGDLEKFLHEDSLPDLVHSGLVHAQFETIHPFLDGNGRVGRLLVTLLLCERKVLHRPLLYLIAYLKRHRTEYYDRLSGIRERGEWEAWLLFYLRGVVEVSREATQTARDILAMRESARIVLQSRGANTKALALLDLLYRQPMLTGKFVVERLDCTKVTASKLIGQLERIGVLQEITGFARNRLYRYGAYLALFEPVTEPPIAIPALRTRAKP